MKQNSLRRNLTVLIALYGVSLIIAAGCPANSASKKSDSDSSKLPPKAQLSGWNPEDNRPIAADKVPKAADEAATEPETPAPDASPEEKVVPVEKTSAPQTPREEYFEGWPKPKVALLITGRQDGYLEPCGCAGLENQKGGLGRRHALVKELESKGWPVVGLDVGNLVRRFGKQAEIQFGISAEALKMMGYRAVGFGLDDLRLSTGEVAAVVAGAEPGQGIFVSANVSVFGLTPRVQVIEAGGVKIGVTSVVGQDNTPRINNAELEVTPPDAALAEVLPQLKTCDVRVLLAYADVEEAQRLAKKFPTFDVVVTAGGGDEPPAEPVTVPDSKTKLIEVGHKGMYAVVLGYYNNLRPMRYQRVGLDSRYKVTDEMHRLMANYQEQLASLGWEGLGLRPAAHPRSQDGNKLSGQFAGAASCKECHQAAYDIWSKSGHAHATETLAKLDPPRLADAECVSCHATGWNPQEFFPYESGFVSLEQTPLMAGNSCENCHGPGAAHIAAERGKDSPLREAERNALKLSVETAELNVCIKCHDLDNSPEFVKPGGFDRYWPKVEH